MTKEASIRDLVNRILRFRRATPAANASVDAAAEAAKAAQAAAREKRLNMGIVEAFNEGKTSGGFRGALERASQYKDPLHNLPIEGVNTNNLDLPKNLMQQGSFKETFKRGVTASFGNTADNLRILTQNMEGKGVLGGAWQGVKNTGELLRRQTRSTMYREISGDVYEKGGKRYIKSKAPWFKDREILGDTGRGSYIVKKRAGIIPLSVATQSPVGIGATIAALPDERITTGQRFADAAVDTALFSLNTPLATANAIGRELKRSTKTQNIKNNIKQIQENR